MMSLVKKTSPALLLALAVLAAPATGAAQSITSVRGLGYPLLPTDARTDALGGLGIGLQGFAVPLTNPASTAGVLRPGGLVSFVTTERALSMGEQSNEIGTTRFPLIRVLYPVGDVVLSAGYGGYLDQSWGLVLEGEQVLADGTIRYEDVVESTGGIGQFELGAALPLGNRFAIGASIGAHTGGQRLTYRRSFDTTSVALLQPYNEEMAWQYSGLLAKVGARWDPVDLLRVGLSVAWSGTLSADSTGGRAVSREIDLPLQVAGGVSAYLAPGLLAAASGRWSDWSVARAPARNPFVDATTPAVDTWEFGGGLEWDDPESRSVRSFPIRLGFQYRELPFALGDEAPTEWVVGGGVGMRVGTNAASPAARVDLSIQRGERTAGGSATVAELSEEMWRVAISIALFGT